jgi:hypothetical protein
MTKPNSDLNFIFTRNPIFYRILALEMIVRNEQAGISVCGYHGVTTHLGYLYCETRRALLLDTKWSEMEKMHLPTKCIGQLPHSGHEMHHCRRSPEYKEPEDARAGVAGALQPYLDPDATFRSSLAQLESLDQVHMASIHDTKNRRRNAGRQLTPLQSLLRLKDFLASKAVKIKFDYITLKVTSYKLLKLIHQEIKCKPGIDHPLYENQGEDEKSMYVPLVIEILKEAKEEESGARRRQTQHP